MKDGSYVMSVCVYLFERIPTAVKHTVFSSSPSLLVSLFHISLFWNWMEGDKNGRSDRDVTMMRRVRVVMVLKHGRGGCQKQLY